MYYTRSQVVILSGRLFPVLILPYMTCILPVPICKLAELPTSIGGNTCVSIHL